MDSTLRDDENSRSTYYRRTTDSNRCTSPTWPKPCCSTIKPSKRSVHTSSSMGQSRRSRRWWRRMSTVQRSPARRRRSSRSSTRTRSRNGAPRRIAADCPSSSSFQSGWFESDRSKVCETGQIVRPEPPRDDSPSTACNSSTVTASGGVRLGRASPPCFGQPIPGIAQVPSMQLPPPPPPPPSSCRRSPTENAEVYPRKWTSLGAKPKSQSGRSTRWIQQRQHWVRRRWSKQPRRTTQRQSTERQLQHTSTSTSRSYPSAVRRSRTARWTPRSPISTSTATSSSTSSRSMGTVGQIQEIIAKAPASFELQEL